MLPYEHADVQPHLDHETEDTPVMKMDDRLAQAPDEALAPLRAPPAAAAAATPAPADAPAVAAGSGCLGGGDSFEPSIARAIPDTPADTPANEPSSDDVPGGCGKRAPKGTADRRHGSGKKRSREPRVKAAMPTATDQTGHPWRSSDHDPARNTAEAALFELAADARGPILLLDSDRVRHRLGTWRRLLPRVAPHFAVGGSPDRALLQRLREDGCGFSCATAEEVRRVLSLGAPPQNVILAHPCPPRAHLRCARRWGVELVTFDSAAQLRKTALEFPAARLLLRVATSDATTTTGLRRLMPRFGASPDEWGPLLALAQELRLRVVGVSVQPAAPPPAGLGRGPPNQQHLTDALSRALAALQAVAARGFAADIVDLGGGLTSALDLQPAGGDPAAAGGDNADASLEGWAARTARQLEEAFPAAEFPRLRLIAELGHILLGQGGASLLTRAPSLDCCANTGVGSPDERRSAAIKKLHDQLPGVIGSFICSQMAREEPQVLRPMHKLRPAAAPEDTTETALRCPQKAAQRGEWLLWRGFGAAGCRLAAGGGGELCDAPCLQVLHYSAENIGSGRSTGTGNEGLS